LWQIMLLLFRTVAEKLKYDTILKFAIILTF